MLRAVLSLLLLLSSCSVSAAEKVVLQLKWEHEFQFAGYYAALWQGFYAEEGLDVEIRPASTPEGQLLNPVDEVAAGRADYAVGALDILVRRDQGVPLVVLAPIFQHSPSSLFALPGVPMATLQDLAGLKIATPAGDFTRGEVLALFHAGNIPLGQSLLVDRPPTIDSLLDGTAQAIATYGISARYAARERGVQLQELSPQSFGLDFYGDTLYTHSRVVKESPEQVRRFLRASLRGWSYALGHRKELARRIARELPRHLFSYADLEGYNEAFAAQIDGYMAYPYTEIGHNNLLRWQHMVNQLRAVGVLQHAMDVRGLIFNAAPPQDSDRSLRVLLLLLTGLLLLFGVYFSRQARHIRQMYLLALLLVAGADWLLEAELQRDHRSALEVDALQQLNGVATRLSGEINRTLAYVTGMAAHIASNPAIDQAGFERYGQAIFREPTLLKNLAAAPDLVVTMVYPRGGNASVLGLDYRQSGQQREVAMRVIDSGRPAVAGPLTLVQGGSAFVVRTRVQAYDAEGMPYVWGLLSAPFMAADLYRAVGLTAPDLALDVAIRGRDGLGASGEVFYGSAELFDDPASVRTTIRVGDGSWQLAAAPHQGWEYQGQKIVIMRGSALLVALVLLLLVWRQRQLAVRSRVELQLRENEALLREMSRVALIDGWRIADDHETLHWSSSDHHVLVEDATSLTRIDSLLQHFEPQGRERLRQALDMALRQGQAFDLELEQETGGQARHWLRCIGTAQRSADGWEVTGALQDISERKRFSEVVERQATTDLLTGLPNRSAFYETLHWALADARRHHESLALLFIDLDRFKPVNDSYGHAVGDQLLQRIARCLQDNLRECDTVARISGDEFTVILRELTDEFTPMDVAERLLEAIRQPHDLEGCQVFCGASIGIAVYPQDATDIDELISRADHAMYEVKKSGRNNCQYFTQSMQERSEQRHSLYLRLQAALANDGLSVEYQPVVDLRSGRATRCEALVRWYDEQGRQIPTGEFIAMAEETSLVNAIDLFVLEKAADGVEALSNRLGWPLGLAVNLSPRLFLSTESALNQWLELALQVARRVPLTVEITERILIEDPERVHQVLDRLKQHGATIAIDDFGTGYSSLSYLTQLPLDYLKIDRSFVENMTTSRPAQMLVDTIFSLARNLGLELVAEGVETPEQLASLRDKGCDYVQGYLLARPMGEAQLEQWLRRR